MKIIRSQCYEEKNIYCFRPVVKGTIRIPPEHNLPSDRIPGLAALILAYLPGLMEHHCSRGYAGGFAERLREGTYPGHIIEHIALELQVQLGQDVYFGRTEERVEGLVDIIVECLVPQVGLAALAWAVKLVRFWYTGKPVPHLSTVLADLGAVYDRFGPGPSTLALLQAARRQGQPVMELGGGIWQIGYGRYARRLAGSLLENTSCLSADLVQDKALTKEILQRQGLPVLPGYPVRTLEEAWVRAEQLGYPVVLKDNFGHQGKKVYCHLQNGAELAECWWQKGKEGSWLLEKEGRGRNFRALLVDGQLVAVAERLPPRVKGDGQRTIRELIEELNRDPRRGQGHGRELTRVEIDAEVLRCLTSQGYTLEQVLPAGAEVNLRFQANLSGGGEAVDVTEEVGPELKKQLELAARLSGLNVCGVDFLAEDLHSPMPADQQQGILEINAAPGLRMHLNGKRGKEIADWIITRLDLQPSQKLPLFAVTGTNGKTTVVRCLAHLLALAGKKVGYTTSDGIYFDKQLIRAGDMSGPLSAREILQHPLVEAAVLETARGGILRQGLGFSYCDVAVYTNLSGDHLGQDGINSLAELADVKALVGEVVSRQGWIILNADDPQLLSMGPRFQGQLFLYTTRAENPWLARHLALGGQGLLVRQGWVLWVQGDQCLPLVKVKELPAAWGGLALHNLENMLAAAGAALAYGLKPELIARGLRTFSCDPETNPGRFNLWQLGKIQVLVDYGHNAAGFDRVLSALQAGGFGPITAVIGMPGDRRNQDIIRAGMVAGKYLHRAIVKEDSNLRGRQPGEMAALLCQGLRTVLSPQDIQVILPELEAVKQALLTAVPGETVVVFYEKLAPLVKLLQELGARPVRLAEYHKYVMMKGKLQIRGR
ncbi:cyanophycin synthetase [Carboxydocella sporoproducens DSM 16521]|uniref:Cyanophycin synthetase n=3 Tax=Clostridia TaxID=186801 RepID=A0A1T4QJE5_9FIRM|nr:MULTISPECIES: cyanophycin synthetase [Carboxydocella]AVX19260.1 cyanophycin synthetase [Carboxydocella thermautotrophica]AVX29673.1 cyanophycin synthetase [Carboxydocella thermautotrophica]SKA03776.1 cyanophycin synthetase [Carboxydocella sporoproducens DSM 16521]